MLGGHGSTPEQRADGLGRISHQLISRVRVLEGSLRIAVPEQPADGEYALALPQGKRGIGVLEIMKAYIRQAYLDTHVLPEAVEPMNASRLATPSGRKHPDAGTGNVRENLAGGPGQPHGSRSGLAVAKEQMTVTVIGPAQGLDLAFPASRQEQEAHGRDLQRPLARRTRAVSGSVGSPGSP